MPEAACLLQRGQKRKTQEKSHEQRVAVICANYLMRGVERRQTYRPLSLHHTDRPAVALNL